MSVNVTVFPQVPDQLGLARLLPGQKIAVDHPPPHWPADWRMWRTAMMGQYQGGQKNGNHYQNRDDYHPTS